MTVMQARGARAASRRRSLSLYDQRINTSAPIFWARGNGNATDETGGTTGTVTGALYGANLIPARASLSAQSFDVDGIDDQISFPNQAKFTITTAISVMVWFRLDSRPSSGNLEELFVRQNCWGLETTDTQTRFFIYRGGSAVGTVGANNALSTVYCAIGTFDGTTTRLYVNGSSVGTPVTTAGAIDSNSNPVQIGAWGAGFYSDGRMQDAAIWNRALTSTEVADIYSAGNTAG